MRNEATGTVCEIQELLHPVMESERPEKLAENPGMESTHGWR